MPTAVPVAVGQLSEGAAGTAETVALMCKLALGDFGARNQRVRALAVSIVSRVPAQDFKAEAAAVWAWVRARCRYVRDPVGVERLAAPVHTLFRDRSGDCDDLAMACAALLGSIGCPVRFVTGGMGRRSWSHVWLQARCRSDWIDLDPCAGHGPGWAAPFPVVTPWPEATAEGFDPGAALADLGAPMSAPAATPVPLGFFFDLFKAEPNPDNVPRSTDPLFPGLPDPVLWDEEYSGNAPVGPDVTPGWDQATNEQRKAWLAVMSHIAKVQGDRAAKVAAAADVAYRVTQGVATLGLSEVARKWDETVAKANEYREKRNRALQIIAKAEAQGDRRTADMVKSKLAAGDAAVAKEMGPLRPFLAEAAGLAFIPQAVAAMGGPVVLALLAALLAALAWAVSEVSGALAQFDAATGGLGSKAILLALVGGLGWFAWKRFGPVTKRNPRLRGR